MSSSASSATASAGPSATTVSSGGVNTSVGHQSSSILAQQQRLLREYWMDDFRPLQDASKALQEALREDESAPEADLWRRIATTHSNPTVWPGGQTVITAAPHLYYPADPHVLMDPMLGSNHNQNYQPTPQDSTHHSRPSSSVQRLHFPPTLFLQHVHSEPLPRALKQALPTVRSQLLMGLLAPAHLAWMTVDDQLFLWSYKNNKGRSDSFCSLAIPGGQFIISVGLVSPKRGVFKSVVEWCMVVATPDQVLLYALVRIDNDSSNAGALEHGDSRLRLIPTNFCMATDHVRILSVCGTDNGRVFLGGDDGCLYEMDYQLAAPHGESEARSPSNPSVEELLDQFYDQGKNVPEVITVDREQRIAPELVALGKRAWDALTSTADDGRSGGGGSRRPHKVRKLNRTSQVPAAAKFLLIPDLVLRGSSFLFGGGTTATGGGQIVTIVVDRHRDTLYTLSSRGWICSFDLSQEQVTLAAVMDTPKTARAYLEAVARGQVLAPYTRHPVGQILFPGGGLSSQASVGGMEGARTILKVADWRLGKPDGRGVGVDNAGGHQPNQLEDILTPVSIHIVEPTESALLTMVAVTAGGLRLYITSLLKRGTQAMAAGNSQESVAPRSCLTLCHIRAPPPTQPENDAFMLVENAPRTGMAPRVSASGARQSRVDASLYNQGLLVMAVGSKLPSSASDSGRQQRPPVGDVIVAAGPDFAVRKLETGVSMNGSGDHPNQTLAIAGGLSETVSLPVSMAVGSAAHDSESLLPGGIVWDIACLPAVESPVVKLMANSRTPTDNDVDLGFPPPFMPQAESCAQSSTSDKLPTKALVSRGSNFNSTALTLIGNVVTNLLLSRPVRHGITFQRPAAKPSPAETQPKFRISKREGWRGFSGTSGGESGASRNARLSIDGKSSSLSMRPNSKSFRLSRWLLRPATVPLSPFATQHLKSPREIIAINAGGMHYFQMRTVLDSLLDALIAAGENVETDPGINDFFASYGYREGCAMCLAIAIGCGPPNSKSGLSIQVQNRARNAALARAFVPKLISLEHTAGGTLPNIKGITALPDPLIPDGYEFRASEIYNGLLALASRLLRPVWNKPAVVVTEGRVVKLHWSSAMRRTAAKVEVLLDQQTLRDILNPLRNLVEFMQSVFSRAVASVPGPQQRNDSMMEIEDDMNTQEYWTGALLHGKIRAELGANSSRLTAVDEVSMARLIEERNIHSLYRALSRVAQLLSLLSVLRRADDIIDLREVEWGFLHGLTVAQLSQTAEGQDRVEKVINSLVMDTETDSSSSGLLDQLATELSDQCYLFFAASSRFAYQGVRKANEAKTCPLSSPRRSILANEAAQFFLRAAEYWQSPVLVSSRSLHSKDKETYSQIAHRAMQDGGPLVRAVELLFQLDMVASIVDVCLATASKFKAGQTPKISSSPANGTLDDLPWERNLYHKKRDAGHVPSHRADNTTSSQIVPYVGDVADKDAIDTCYALVFHHLTLLLNKRSPLAENMVSSCAAASDERFLQEFFLYLIASDHADTLLRIDSQELERFLRNRGDPELLWRYHSTQGRYEDAGHVLWETALDPTGMLPLDERIDCLARALNAFRGGLERKLGSAPSDGQRLELSQKVKEVSETLHVARLQKRVLNAIASGETNLDIEISADQMKRLKTTLIHVSVLYNEYAAELRLFDHCLLILHFCRYDDMNSIRRLWKNVICEQILPCWTRSQDVYEYLQDYVAEISMGSDIILVADSIPNGVQQFESAAWLPRLETKIVELGKELYGTGADYVFPVDYLLHNLEGLRRLLNDIVPSWSLVTLSQAGVPFLILLETYITFAMSFDRDSLIGADEGTRFANLVVVIDFINYWIGIAKAGRTNAARQEFLHGLSSGRLMLLLDNIRARLEALPNASILRDAVENIDDAIRGIRG